MKKKDQFCMVYCAGRNHTSTSRLSNFFTFFPSSFCCFFLHVWNHAFGCFSHGSYVVTRIQNLKGSFHSVIALLDSKFFLDKAIRVTSHFSLPTHSIKEKNSGRSPWSNVLIIVTLTILL
jgi:hypothetical protein